MTKKEVQRIKSNLQKGVQPTVNQSSRLLGAWLKLFGTGGCDCYPCLSEREMLNDII